MGVSKQSEPNGREELGKVDIIVIHEMVISNKKGPRVCLESKMSKSFTLE